MKKSSSVLLELSKIHRGPWNRNNSGDCCICQLTKQRIYHATGPTTPKQHHQSTSIHWILPRNVYNNPQLKAITTKSFQNTKFTIYLSILISAKMHWYRLHRRVTFYGTPVFVAISAIFFINLYLFKTLIKIVPFRFIKFCLYKLTNNKNILDSTLSWFSKMILVLLEREHLI